MADLLAVVGDVFAVLRVIAAVVLIWLAAAVVAAILICRGIARAERTENLTD